MADESVDQEATWLKRAHAGVTGQIGDSHAVFITAVTPRDTPSTHYCQKSSLGWCGPVNNGLDAPLLDVESVGILIAGVIGFSNCLEIDAMHIFYHSIIFLMRRLLILRAPITGIQL